MNTPSTGSLPLSKSTRDGRGSAWSTSTAVDPTDTMPGELDALSRHVGHGSRGRMFALGSYADSIRSFIAPRLVTVLVVAALIGIAVSIAV